MSSRTTNVQSRFIPHPSINSLSQVPSLPHPSQCHQILFTALVKGLKKVNQKTFAEIQHQDSGRGEDQELREAQMKYKLDGDIYTGIGGVSLMDYTVARLLATQLKETSSQKGPEPSFLSSPFIQQLSPRELALQSDELLCASLSPNLVRANSIHADASGRTHLAFLTTELGMASMVLIRALDGFKLPSTEIPSHVAVQDPGQATLPQAFICRGNGDQRIRGTQADLKQHLRKSSKILIDAIQMMMYQDREASSDRISPTAFSPIESGILSPIHSDQGAEVLYGRAGLLYALLLLRSRLESSGKISDQSLHRGQTPPLLGGESSLAEIEAFVSSISSDDRISHLVVSIIRRGVSGALSYREDVMHTLGGANTEAGIRADARLPALMWSWHKKRYLGGAHGVAGILEMLLSAPFNIVVPHLPLIVQTANWLLSIQNSVGNWPSSAPVDGTSHIESGSEDRVLIQWCHGAAGVLNALSRLYILFTSPTTSSDAKAALRESEVQLDIQALTASMVRAAQLVYDRGLLRKGVGLCHGIAGSVYALLAVFSALRCGAIASFEDAAGGSGKTEITSDQKQHHVQQKQGPSGSQPQKAPPMNAALSHSQSAPKPSLYLIQATHLALLAASSYEDWTNGSEMRTPDHPWSLYEGLAGMCCAWAEVDWRLRSNAAVSGGIGGSLHVDAGRKAGWAGMPGFADF